MSLLIVEEQRRVDSRKKENDTSSNNHPLDISRTFSHRYSMGSRTINKSFYGTFK